MQISSFLTPTLFTKEHLTSMIHVSRDGHLINTYSNNLTVVVTRLYSSSLRYLEMLQRGVVIDLTGARSSIKEFSLSPHLEQVSAFRGIFSVATQPVDLADVRENSARQVFPKDCPLGVSRCREFWRNWEIWRGLMKHAHSTEAWLRLPVVEACAWRRDGEVDRRGHS
ncbi:uncharacterized protein LOC143185114 [Calliopsis andreniformis]|uniref:uncharacterized protein LOC143185114 n=1 Tax=Calliopsis andreniformis TaxID=337506 RepID=UPI003FCE494E